MQAAGQPPGALKLFCDHATAVRSGVGVCVANALDGPVDGEYPGVVPSKVLR